MSGSRTTNLRTGSPGAARRSSSAKSSPSVRSSRQVRSLLNTYILSCIISYHFLFLQFFLHHQPSVCHICLTFIYARDIYFFQRNKLIFILSFYFRHAMLATFFRQHLFQRERNLHQQVKIKYSIYILYTLKVFISKKVTS